MSPMADPSIGPKIRRARERKRMRQQDLADALGVSRTTVDAWENGRAYPRSSIGALEHVLGIGLDEPAFRPISDRMRQEIADALPGDIAAQRYVIGVLEGTITR